MIWNACEHTLRLCRVPLSLFAAFSAGTGFLLAPHPSAVQALLPSTMVCLLACGASALNQYQERDIDARMERTRERPLPSKALTPGRALFAAIALLSSGLAGLGVVSLRSAALGLTAIGWYNGLYTFLKKRTALAFLPGAIVGMIPPAIGWTAAGGSPSRPTAYGHRPSLLPVADPSFLAAAAPVWRGI